MSYGKRDNSRRPSLIIRNLPLDTRKSEVEDLFSPFGGIKDVYLPLNHYTRRFQGFGFVEFHDSRDADEAQEQLDNQVFGGRTLEVRWSRDDRKTPREMLRRERDEPPRGGGGYDRRDDRGPPRGGGGGSGHSRRSFSPRPPRRSYSPRRSPPPRRRSPAPRSPPPRKSVERSPRRVPARSPPRERSASPARISRSRSPARSPARSPPRSPARSRTPAAVDEASPR